MQTAILTLLTSLLLQRCQSRFCPFKSRAILLFNTHFPVSDIKKMVSVLFRMVLFKKDIPLQGNCFEIMSVL
jgi:hypothetical protein